MTERTAQQRNDEWLTPRWLTEILPQIDLDPCAHPSSSVRAAAGYDIRRGEDGLALPWRGVVFCNPPYTRTAKWLARCRAHGESGRTAIALVPAVPGDGPWSRDVWGRAARVGFILGRLAFRDPRTDAAVIRGRGHALVVWGPVPELPPHPRIAWVTGAT